MWVLGIDHNAPRTCTAAEDAADHSPYLGSWPVRSMQVGWQSFAYRVEATIGRTPHLGIDSSGWAADGCVGLVLQIGIGAVE